MMVGQEREPKSLTYGREQQHDFHHRKIVADTSTRAAAKREVSILRQAVGEFFGPAFRIKSVRLWKEPRVSLRYPLKHKQLRLGRNSVAAQFEFLNCLAPHAVRRRVEPHRLFRDPLR